ncbi:MAG TPA: hypothetical protein VFE31_12075 [Opitutaceae bacterium]|nr:hypothetical protein [Opitutaceae bacterium]
MPEAQIAYANVATPSGGKSMGACSSDGADAMAGLQTRLAPETNPG